MDAPFSSAFAIAVIVMRSTSNRLSELLSLIPEPLAAIPTARPGAVTYIGV